MSVDITEFVEINPENVDAVFKAANGTSFLMIKQEGDYGAHEEHEKKLIDELEEMHDGEEAEKSEFCGDPTCEICVDRASKGKLSMAQRRQIPKSSFAIPEKAPASGSYPINDKAHARNALSRVAQHGTPEEKARVRRAVSAKFPGIGKGKKKGKKAMASNQDMPGQSAQEHEGTPSPSSLMGQTNANDRKQARMSDNAAPGKPNMPDGGRPDEEGHGGGDTAPDKELHIEEAKSQTNARVAAQTSMEDASKEVADMKGDPMPKARDEGAEAHGEASSQTEHNKRGDVPSDGIRRDQMTRQNEQAQKAFKFKVKKGGKKKHKKNSPLEISGAMKQKAPQRVLSEALASKEFDDMNGAELAEVFTTALDARDARKAAEKKERKAKKKAKAEKKAKKAEAKRVKNGGDPEEAAAAAKSATPERLTDGIAEVVSEALKQGLSPLVRDIENLKNQPARFRPAINNGADPKAVLRDQKTPGGASPMDVLKPLEDAFKSEGDPYKKEKLGNELTKARFIIAERIRQGQPVSQSDAAIAAATAAR